MNIEIEKYQVGKVIVRVVYDDTPMNPRQDFDNVGTMVCWHSRYELGDEQPKEDAAEYKLDLLRRVGEDQFVDSLDQQYEDVYALMRERHPALPYGSDRYFREFDDLIAPVKLTVVEKLDEHYTILPLYLYDHGGITMSTGSFSCPWDSGQVGFIYCSLKKAQSEWGTEDSKFNGWSGDASSTREEGTTRTLREATTRYLEGEVKEYDQYLTGEVYGYVIENEDGDHLDSCYGFFGDIEYVRSEADSMASYHNKGIDKEIAERLYWESREVETV